MLSQKPLTPAIEEAKRATGNVFLDNYMLDFLDEIGKDFTFIGEEYRIQVGKHDYYMETFQIFIFLLME